MLFIGLVLVIYVWTCLNAADVDITEHISNAFKDRHELSLENNDNENDDSLIWD